MHSDVRSDSSAFDASQTWEAAATVVRADEGDVVWIANDRAQIKLSADQTADAFALAINTVAPDGGPCAHRHSNEDEAFYVLDGQIDFTLGDRVCRAKRGDFIWAPRRQVHGFHNPTKRDASFAVFVTPGSSFEAFARRCGNSWNGKLAPNGNDLARCIGAVAWNAPHFGIEMLPQHATTARAALPEPPAALNVGGNDVRLLLTGEQSRQAACIAEITCGTDTAPPVHAHVNQAEVFLIVEGTLQVRTSTGTHWLRTGDVAYVPAGVMHTFTGIGPGRTRFLSYHTPAGIEHFFTEVDSHRGSTSLATMPADAQHLLLRRHGMTVAR